MISFGLREPPRPYLSIIGLWLALVCVMAYLGITAFNSYRTARLAAMERMVSYAQLIAAHDSFLFEYAGNVLGEVAERLHPSDFTKDVDSERKDGVREMLAQHWRQIPGVKVLRIVDHEGNTLLRHAIGEVPENVGAMSYFLEVQRSTGSSLVGSTPEDIRSEGNAIPVALRVTSDGKFIGAVVLTLSIDDVFYPFYAQLDLGQGTVVKLRSRSALVTRFPGDSSHTGTPFPAEGNGVTKMIEAHHQKGMAEFNSQVDGTARIYAFERISGTNLYAVAATPVATAMDGATKEVFAALAAAVVALIAGLMATSNMKRLTVSHGMIVEAAYRDTLTGLHSRLFLNSAFHDLSVTATQGGGGFCFVFADLDNFKLVNDSLGYSNGDQLLVAAADRIRDVIGPSDVAVRFSGDKFVIIHPIAGGDPKHAAEVFCWKLQEALRAPTIIAGKPVSPNASIGAALFPYHGETLDELTRKADIAMCHGKCFGKGMFTVYYPGLDGAVDGELTTHVELVSALENNEFELYFAPSFDLKSGAIASAEVLLRWRRKDASVVPAQNFIHLAEQTGLIVPIGKWVVDETCRTAARWKQSGYPVISFCINVSALQFNQHDIEQYLVESLKVHGVPPAMLSLEIRESVMLSDNEVVLGRIQRLADVGIRVVVDDFGTGYASLSSLHKNQIGAIKIARPIADSVAHDQRARPLVSAMVEMAHAMNMKIAAGGVETIEALNIFREMGCDEAQGYLFTRPLSYDGLMEFAREFDSGVINSA